MYFDYFGIKRKSLNMDSFVIFVLLNFFMGCPVFGPSTGGTEAVSLQAACSTDCPANKRCVHDNATVIWELNSSNECKNYTACYGTSSDYPDDTVTTTTFAGRFYPVVIAWGSSLYFEAKYASTFLQPYRVYNVSQANFLGCSDARQLVGTLMSAIRVPDMFVSTLGYKFFIATGNGLIVTCNLGFRLHLNVKEATNCSGVSRLPPGGQLCSGKGRCVSESFTGGMHCECCAGYSGPYCEEYDACYAQPCKRGNCSDVVAGHGDAFNCTCEAGFTGDACDIDIEECKVHNIVCQNGGFCDDGINSYECLCASGFHGKHCEFVSNLCELLKPCKNNANCSRVGNLKQSYSCQCAPGWYGRNCTLNTTTSSLIPQLSTIAKTSTYDLTSNVFPMVKTSPWYLMTASSYSSSPLPSTADVKTVSQFYSSVESNPVLESTAVFSLPSSLVMSQTESKPMSPSLILNGISSSSVNQVSLLHTSQATVASIQDSAFISDAIDRTITPNATTINIPSSSDLESSSPLSSHSSNYYTRETQTLPELSSSIQSVQNSLVLPSETSNTISPAVTRNTNLEQTLTVDMSISPSHVTLSPSNQISPTAFMETSQYSVTRPVYSPTPTLASVAQVVTHPASSPLPTLDLVSPSLTMVIPSSIVVPTQRPVENKTCADNPCGLHGVCTNRADAGFGLPFQCDCRYPTVGPVCSTDLELHFPYFNGNSYIKFKPITFGSALNEFVISFRTLADGTLLFSGHTTYRDFIKLDVAGGLLRFSVDAGDKVVSVTSQERVASGNTTAASFGYDTRTGTVFMSVNNGARKRTTTRGKLRDVQLYHSLYLGGVVPVVYTENKPHIGAITPFVGCIRELEFNERAIELSDAVDWQNISECDIPACQAKPCKNGGVCVQDNEDSQEYSCQCSYPYSGKNCEEKYACKVNVCNGGKCLNASTSGVACLCPFGRGGVSCNQDVEVTIPMFSVVKNHSSYLQYIAPRAVVNQLDIRMEIKLSNDTGGRKSGLLFYVGLHDHLSVGSDGDYLALGVTNNHVVLQFNLGSGGATITSDRELIYDQEWFTILAGRKGRDGYLYVDNDVKEGRSPPPLVALNVFGHLYLGGVPEFSMLNSEVMFTEGFRGSIKDPKVRTGISNSWISLATEHSTNTSSMAAVVMGLNVQDQRLNACVVGACKNNGSCQSLGASYICQCLPMWSGMTCNDTSVPCRDYNPCHGRSTCRMRDTGFTCDCPFGKLGRYCENDINITVPLFGEYSYLSFSLSKIKIHSETSLTITFSTAAANGILFYVTKDMTSLSGDFLSVTLHDKHVYLIFNLGTGIAKCKSQNEIMYNQINNITLARDARKADLALNGNHTSCSSRGGATQLNVASVFYLGGVPDLSLVQPMAYENTRDLKDFTGCVEQLLVNGHSFDLTSQGVKDGRNILNCDTSSIQV